MADPETTDTPGSPSSAEMTRSASPTPRWSSAGSSRSLTNGRTATVGAMVTVVVSDGTDPPWFAMNQAPTTITATTATAPARRPPVNCCKVVRVLDRIGVDFDGGT